MDVATSAEQALAMDLRSYYMIVIDIRMPRMDGFQFYDAIKSKVDDAAKTKVCFFTASVIRRSAKEGFLHGTGVVL